MSWRMKATSSISSSVQSDSSAAGEEYFKEHGDYEVDDYNWAMEKGLIPEGYYEWVGL